MESLHSSYEYNGLKVTLTTVEHTISEVLEAFDHVLRGSGFYPPKNHVLAYVKEI